MTNQTSFTFDTELHLVVLTGINVTTLVGLRAELHNVPASSIFFHTHRVYLAHDFQRSTHANDFARWVSTALHEEALAEKLASVDLLAFTNIENLRETLINIVDEYLSALDRPSPECRAEEAFHFCRSRNFVVPTGLVAKSVDDFFEKMRELSNASLYFHFFEARLRLGHRTNDFSRWLADQGHGDLAAAIDGLNPYSRTLDELREDIVQIGIEAQRKA